MSCWFIDNSRSVWKFTSKPYRFISQQSMARNNWLVVSTYPSEKSWSESQSSVGMMTFPRYGNKKNPNHQPDHGLFHHRLRLTADLSVAMRQCRAPCWRSIPNLEVLKEGAIWRAWGIPRIECLYELNFEYQQIYVNTNLIYIWLNYKIWLVSESLNLYVYFWVLPTNNTIMFCWFVNFGTFSLESIIFPNQSHENWIGT